MLNQHANDEIVPMLNLDALLMQQISVCESALAQSELSNL